MLHHSRAAIATGTLAALLTLTGNAVSAAAPAALAATGVVAAAAKSGHEQFHLTSKVATARRQQAQATGILTAHGHAVLGKTTGDRQTIWIVFSHGSIRLVTEVTRKSVSVPNPTTCKFAEFYRGSYRVRGGNRRYVHAAGTGTFLTKIVGKLKRKDGSCTSTLIWFWQSTKATGTLSW
jgi:hypothetical protein